MVVKTLNSGYKNYTSKGYNSHICLNAALAEANPFSDI